MRELSFWSIFAVNHEIELLIISWANFLINANVYIIQTCKCHNLDYLPWLYIVTYNSSLLMCHFYCCVWSTVNKRCMQHSIEIPYLHKKMKYRKYGPNSSSYICFFRVVHELPVWGGRLKNTFIKIWWVVVFLLIFTKQVKVIN